MLRAEITRNVSAKLWGEAAEGLARLASIAPEAFEEPAIRTMARKAGIASATDAPDSADTFFEAISEGAGSGGPDVLLAIVEAGGTSTAAKRATQLLRRAEVQARATNAVRVAFDLRDAPCNVKLDHLERAIEHGDERALVALEISVRPCFKNPKKVDEAIEQLRLRLEGR